MKLTPSRSRMISVNLQTIEIVSIPSGHDAALCSLLIVLKPISAGERRAMTSSGIEDDLGAWGSPSAGHPRASAHIQSFVQKTLILAPIKQDLV